MSLSYPSIQAASLPSFQSVALPTPQAKAYRAKQGWLLPKPSDVLVSVGVGLTAGVLLSRHRTAPIKQKAMDTLASFNKKTTPGGSDTHRMEGWVNNPLYLTFLMPFLHPEMAPMAFLYALSLGGAFVLGNAFQGVQEAWVRWEESYIRSRLVGSLQGSFQQSIEAKLQQDATLRQQTERYLESFPPLEANAASPTSSEPPATTQDARFPFAPFNRDPSNPKPPRASVASNNPSLSRMQDETETPAPPPLFGQSFGKATVLGASFLASIGLGMLANNTLALMLDRNIKALAEKVKPEVGVNLNIQNLEAVTFFFRKEWMVLASLAALGSGVRIGQLLIEGLREVQVTSMNAQTESQYETYKWTVLDPQFHAIAEEARLKQQLQQLEADYPRLRQQPALLAKRKQQILDSIGYNSSPAYYPITPMVQLVPARG